MYYEMSYGLNIEMHKQSEIVKRLNSIIAQILPFLSQEVSTDYSYRLLIPKSRVIGISANHVPVPAGDSDLGVGGLK